ncbi:hypothetical protein [Acidisoma silvae]|uniref:Uncharacterized protein n=1 Tax=Acidisoma silvae TaxID=2802396 RepID=A0A964E1E1_9PROT|nr:hypothetical protein [Acidisoma silvae]MCB8878251.1 hypothetical protein [Acidisoma silvae]
MTLSERFVGRRIDQALEKNILGWVERLRGRGVEITKAFQAVAGLVERFVDTTRCYKGKRKTESEYWRHGQRRADKGAATSDLNDILEQTGKRTPRR